MFFPQVFWLLIVIAAFFKKDKKNEIKFFFYVKEFEIGYVLIFSSVKLSTYRYYTTNKILSFIYHCLHAHHISLPQKEFFNY